MLAVTAERLRKLQALAARPGTPGEGAAARAAIDRLMARLRPPPPPPPKTIIGLRLRLDRDCDRRNPCCDRHGIIHPGCGPHRYSLRCACCGKHRGWIKASAGDLLRAMQRDGRLTAAPILRDAGIAP
jgi:hypothetical protein